MKNVTHAVDFCVVGGGVAGMCAAVAAARHGAKVALVQDRPVLGGNASSEIRMWIGGAHGANHRETGIVHEILLENQYRNPLASYSIWDSVLYGIVRQEPNIQLLLNCSCTGAEMDGARVKAITGWQGTAETWQRVEAALFADCSGDSILAPLTGAEFRIGREARGEFNEDIEPEVADRRTMGMSCLIQAREYATPQPFIPPVWANRYAADHPALHHRFRGHSPSGTNFWFLELGGEYDSIHDTEMLRDELLKVAFGMWDHIKNQGDHGAANWGLEWVGFLPGKRESRRYMGDHLLTQNDVRAEGRFDDLVAYGGWSMDDHHPAGFLHPGAPTIFHPAPSPYGIPYRSLYSRNIANLFCAGRNISTTHAALSSTRVMATCAVIGQAVGTAAAIAARHGLLPRGVYQQRLAELQQTLMDDDAYLPWHRRAVSAVSATAQLTASHGDPEPLRNGWDRPIGNDDNGCTVPLGGWVQYTLAKPAQLTSARVVFDSELDQDFPRRTQPSSYPLAQKTLCLPGPLVRNFRMETRAADGTWSVAVRVTDNHLRMVRVPLAVTTDAVRLVSESSWGADAAHLFAFEVG